MTSKIIILTGLSGVGKSTISRSISEELSMPAVHASAIIRRYAESQGYRRLSHFFKGVGVQNAYIKVRPLILAEIVKHAEKGNVLVEGLYDIGLYRELQKRFGQKSITVINLTANRSFRRHQHALRKGLPYGKGRADVRKRDAVKWAGGLQQMLKESQIKVRNTKSIPVVIRKVITQIRRI